MLFTYKVTSTGEITTPCATPACMQRREDVTLQNGATNIQEVRYEGMVFTRYDEKNKIMLQTEDFKRPSHYTQMAGVLVLAFQWVWINCYNMTPEPRTYHFMPHEKCLPSSNQINNTTKLY